MLDKIRVSDYTVVQKCTLYAETYVTGFHLSAPLFQLIDLLAFFRKCCHCVAYQRISVLHVCADVLRFRGLSTPLSDWFGGSKHNLTLQDAWPTWKEIYTRFEYGSRAKGLGEGCKVFLFCWKQPDRLLKAANALNLVCFKNIGLQNVAVYYRLFPFVCSTDFPILEYMLTACEESHAAHTQI